jgi:hypothetical protein
VKRSTCFARQMSFRRRLNSASGTNDEHSAVVFTSNEKRRRRRAGGVAPADPFLPIEKAPAQAEASYASAVPNRAQ